MNAICAMNMDLRDKILAAGGSLSYPMCGGPPRYNISAARCEWATINGRCIIRLVQTQFYEDLMVIVSHEECSKELADFMPGSLLGHPRLMHFLKPVGDKTRCWFCPVASIE
jgi:hypothetical protein